jgi:hypothetical protein
MGPPIGSAILIGSLTRSRSWQSHVGKAIGLGLVMVAISSVVGLLIYDHYPRPSYWSQGNTALEAYFIFPLFPLLSAILGGLVSGTLWWRRGESNPRPKSATPRSLHAYLSSIGFASRA